LQILTLKSTNNTLIYSSCCCNFTKLIIAGETLPPLEHFLNWENHTERAPVVSIRDLRYGSSKMATAFLEARNRPGKHLTTQRRSISRLFSKNKYTGLSDDAISAFEHNERRTEQQATERLNRIFRDDKQSH
jgi:hypothetical protein